MARKTPHRADPRPNPAQGGRTPAGDVRPEGPPAPVLTAVLIVLALLLVAGGWFAYSSLTRPISPEPDRGELTAIDSHLTAIEDLIRPIATALAAQTADEASGVIDVAAYREKVADVRDLVDSTNDRAATSADSLEIRDLVLTGGSQVVTGLNEMLDALAADDSTAVTGAAVHVEEGLGNLQAARRRLDVALGRIQDQDQ
jgi:hypothetical protein